MSIICNSSCISYVTDKGITTATIESYNCVNNSSNCSNTVSPPAFPVTVTIDNSQSPNTIYHISVGQLGNSNNLNYDLTILPNGAGLLSNIPNGVSVSFPLGQGGSQSCGSPNSAVTKITLVSSNNSLYPSQCTNGFFDGSVNGSTTESPYVSDDSYTINVLSCCGTQGTRSVDIVFERALKMAMLPECYSLDCLSSCQNVKVPVILIAGQTTINGSDVADMLFTIYDKYSYEKENPLPKTRTCTFEYGDKIDLVETVLRICSAKIVSVLRGKGTTAYCKADYIWSNLRNTKQQPTLYLNSFYERLIKYAMLRFILSRLLYGTFNINYLLGKYNQKFLTDLAHSRFCAFIQQFQDCQSDIYDFAQYFKKDNGCDDINNDKIVPYDNYHEVKNEPKFHEVKNEPELHEVKQPKINKAIKEKKPKNKKVEKTKEIKSPKKNEEDDISFGDDSW